MEMIENTIWYRGRADTILVDGVELSVETDHRAVLLFWQLLQDGTLPMVVRTRLFSRLAVPEGAEAVDPARLFTALLAFYGFTTGQGVPGRPHFDLWYDGERIVASFRAAYGIDLLEESLHWHRFWHCFGNCRRTRCSCGWCGCGSWICGRSRMTHCGIGCGRPTGRYSCRIPFGKEAM